MFSTGDGLMNRFMIAIAIAASAFVAGCQTGGPPLGKIPEWRFPCGQRAFNAGQCDKLGGMPDTDFNLTGRVFGNE